MKIVSIDGDMGIVEAYGVERQADLSMVQGAMEGAYVLVHAGFAIQTVDEEEALHTLKMLEEVAAQEENYGLLEDEAPQMMGRDSCSD